METLIGYLISLALGCGGSYAMGRLGGRKAVEQLNETRAGQVLANHHQRIKGLEDLGESLTSGFREMGQESSQLDSRISRLEKEVGDLQAGQQEAATQAAASMASLLDERTRNLVTREEVQNAFAEVAKQTAAQELARQKEIQRQMTRREEVFGPARNAPKPTEPMDPELLQSLQGQLESLRRSARL